ncbi:hypothetical protein B0H17DRAFT_1194472 [Mycena rosella]|uniref:UV excision repair protein RAD23 n=1 Tax=Mycena rosella TaxID=1033263 RepID=A0AAD7E0L8_MYCRO|nr:hypothetical protein B0H17DRAFT_1194472 [Mycena rosella]
MKVTVKTTQQKVFQIDAEPADTVAILKEKIKDAQGHPTAIQKIIYSGKVLADDKTIESCGIKEKDFLVLMVSKPKPTPSPMPAASSSVAADPQPAPAAAPAPAATASFLSGEALQSTIANMMEMGFTREEVTRAMRASYNNPDRAAEYLMTGIPAHLEAEASGAPAGPPAGLVPPRPRLLLPRPVLPPLRQHPRLPPPHPPLAQQQQQQQQQAGAGAGAAGGAPGAHLDLAALQNNPQIQQLRELMVQNPALIQPLIQQLGAQNPALMQMIEQNPAAVARLFGVDGADFEEGEDGPVPPGAHVVSVTEEERAAIQRLEALGFPRQAVLEAYFACDKNEELAANYLFESAFED